MFTIDHLPRSRAQLILFGFLAGMLGLAAGLATPTLAQGPSPVLIELAPGPLVLEPGQEAEVEVRVTDVRDLYAVSLKLQISDPLGVQILDNDASKPGTQVAAGDLLKPDGTFINKVTASSGLIEYAAGLQGAQPGRNGSGSLIKIRLKAVANTKATLAFLEAELSTPQSLIMPTVTRSSSVIVSNSAVVSIAPGSAQVSGVGASQAVEIRVSNVKDLFLYNINLRFDPSILQVQDASPGDSGVQVEVGDFLDLDNFLIVRNVADNVAGRVELVVTETAPGDGSSGSGLLARITFSGRGLGTSALTFEEMRLLKDGRPDPLPIESQIIGGQVVVGLAVPTATALPVSTATRTPGITCTPPPCPCGRLVGECPNIRCEPCTATPPASATPPPPSGCPSPAPTSASGFFSNISTRGFVGTGDNVMIAGFIVADKPVKVAVRALGPSLTARGVAGVLRDPTVELFDTTQAEPRRIGFNDNYADAEVNRLSGYRPPEALDALILATLPKGQYTAVVRGKGDTTGVGLVEVFWIRP